MDFDLTDEQRAVVELGRRILSEHADPARLRRLDGEGWMDRQAWSALAEAGLLGLHLPADVGGGGLGALAGHLLLEELGRSVANVPLWEVLTSTAAVAAFADAPVDLLGPVLAGDEVWTVACHEAGAAPDDPQTSVDAGASGTTVTGTKVLVPCVEQASRLVVTAASGDAGAVLCLVDTADTQVRPHRTSGDVPHAEVRLDRTPARVLGPADGSAVRWLLERSASGLASMQSGMCQAAVALAADYTSERQQFERPIATFQAVSQRVAQAFIEAECASLTALQAAWALDAHGQAPDEVAIAKWWAAEAGHRVLHAVQHVHGGVGVDRDYPLHRYLLRTKQNEFLHGTAADHLTRLGTRLAATPA